MSLERRIESLEKHTGSERKLVWLVVVCKDYKKAEAKKKAAIAEYLAAHPQCSEKDIENIIFVSDEETKQLLSQVKERTRKLTSEFSMER